jgi:hypothetical protein
MTSRLASLPDPATSPARVASGARRGRVPWRSWVPPNKSLLVGHHGQRSSITPQSVNEAAIKAGETAIKTLMLVNGGAAVSVLAFIGGLVGQGRVTVKQMTDVSSSLLWFVAGVALAAVALAFSYFTNFGHVNLGRSKLHTWQHPYVIDGPTTNRWWWWSLIFHSFAIAAAVLSLVAFVVGAIDVRASIIRLGQ